jgi:hypothetical protein
MRFITCTLQQILLLLLLLLLLLNIITKYYCYDIKSRRVGWAGHVERMKEMRNSYKMLAGKPERTRLLVRPRRRWEK